MGGIFGCTRSGEFGSIISDAQKASLIKGKTTKTEVLNEFGNPDQKIDLGNGMEQFSYIKESYKATNALVAESSTSTFTEFWIVFDSNGVVKNFGERPTTKQPNYFK